MSDWDTEWITIKEAAKLTEYSVQYMRRIVRQGRVQARKWANVWMVHKESLLEYQREMQRLGSEKHDPWRTGARQKNSGGD